MDTNARLTIQAISPAEWKGDTWISLVPASAQALPGQPAKKVGDVVVSQAADGQKKLLISTGPANKLNAEAIRQAGGAAAKWLPEHGIYLAGVRQAELDEIGVAGALEAFSEGLMLGAFRFEQHKSKTEEREPVVVNLLAEGENLTRAKASLAFSSAAASGTNLARSVAHEPPNVINPQTLGERAAGLASEYGLKCTVLGKEELSALGAGALLAVGLGSRTGSRLIALEYPGQGEGVGTAPVVVVGKAITFDTGGYSLKDSTNIVGMKYDKSGGAVVLGVMQAIATLKLPVPVVGLIAAAENMISAESYRPDDIIKTLSGKTVEIVSTDAEGRMVLADALTYAHTHYSPRAVIDLATLTGGIVVALGKVRAGLMSNNDALAEALLACGEHTHERLWRMPLDEDYFELIKGDDGDMKNSSGIRQAHPIVGGIFLRQYVPDEVAWAHLDIAGPATVEKEQPYCPKGATGFGVRLLVEYLRRLAG